MIIWRPSIFVGKDSTTASSLRSSRTRLSTSIPICWWAISRPRKRSVILALSPSSRKRIRLRSFYLIIAIVGTVTEFNFLNLDNFLLLLLFLRRLTFFIKELAVVHDTTNWRFGVRLISTKSTPASSAFSIALRLTIPSCSPSRPVKRTSGRESRH